MDEKVDILTPPTFVKSKVVKYKRQAWKDGDWIGSFNLWIIQEKPVPSIVYQLRSPNLGFWPNKLDVSVGGHYKAGEGYEGGIREVKEELGKNFFLNSLTLLGKRVFISTDENKIMRNYIVDIFITIDNSDISTYTLQKEEVYALFSLPINKLIKVHTINNYSFKAKGIDNNRKPIVFTVKKDSFPYNFDNYHLKMPLLAKRFLKKEKNLIY